MNDTKTLSKALSLGIQECSLSLSESIQIKLLQYLELLSKWNTVHNLTAIRDPKEMISKHLLDSLSLVPYLTKGVVLDVGTGAGIPGIPLALALPEVEFVLLDSNQKKITFVQHVILSLKLQNVRAICQRVEAYQPPILFDWVVSRAFASLVEFVRLSRHLCKNEGQMVAMKGKVAPEEIAAVPQDVKIEVIQAVSVPTLEAARHLVFMAFVPSGGKA